MSAPLHPASQNALQRYRQAGAIFRSTTRSTNPAWYLEALELDHQLHLRVDGVDFSSFLFNRKTQQWSAGASLSEEICKDPAKSAAFAAELLRQARALGANALGVILHVADEVATTDLKPELDNPAALSELRVTAVENPASILGDSSVPADQASWRVLPYPAAGGEPIGTTLTISRDHASFLNSIRAAGQKANFPLVTQALSAPLVAMMGLANLVTPTEGKPFVAILQYPWFTVVAFFSDHRDLRLIRTLQHRGMRRATNFRQTLNTTNASLEFVDPDLYLLPLGESVDSSLAADLRVTFNQSKVEVLQVATPEAVRPWNPEPLFATQQVAQEGALDSLTFVMLRDERWALQDFLPAPIEEQQVYPSREEMRLLRAVRYARLAAILIALLMVVYLSFGIVRMLMQEEWFFKVENAQNIKTQLARLNVERSKEAHWSNLLADRSKAWVDLESLARLFPSAASVKVKNYSHSVKPESAAGQAEVGFIKEWRINGLARDEALERLNRLNTREGISAHFAEIARITGNEAYRLDIGSRSILVNVRTQENGAFKLNSVEDLTTTDDATYPYTFDLTITQRFEASDPLALKAAQAP